MNTCELSIAITALANSIANSVDDNDQLSLLGAAISQLGDTLSTIAAQRSLCEKRKSNSATIQQKKTTGSSL